MASKNIIFRIVSSVRDTLSSKYHSKDFIFARSEYLRTRIRTISLIFTLLIPFWTVFDWWLLPDSALSTILSARAIMFIGMLLIFYVSGKPRLSAAINFLLSGATLALPSIFYAIVLIALPDNESHTLIGYSFIPYLLVATLGILPFTLIESSILGFGLLLLQFLSGFVTGTSITAQSLQDLWLLAALLTIVMTTNHFHLSLLLRLYRQAAHDPLTGLLNRISLDRHTEHIEDSETRSKTAVILLDIDYFKKINDTYGHSVGDDVLRVFSKLLKKEANKNDIMFRYGGEEFLIISTNINKQDAIALAEHIRQTTQQLQLHDLDQVPFSITVSLGVSSLRDNENIQSTIQRADERLYKAKRAGRNQVISE